MVVVATEEASAGLSPEAAAYVEREIKPTLSKALIELARERPADPVTALAELLVQLKPPPPLAPPPSNKLQLIHFNDVYNCETPKKEGKMGGAARFISAIKEVATPEALTFFSGDAFNPSIMSTVVRGGQLPLVLNAAGVNCAVVGNHDFDFGPERLRELLSTCDFPWLCSNVQRANDANVYDTYTPLVEGLSEYTVLSVGGRRIGCMGLVEDDWLETLFGIPRSAIAYEDYTAAATRLAATLRAPPHSCDVVLALTHMRQPNDDALARSCKAVGVHAILAGHDHHYGVTEVRLSCRGPLPPSPPPNPPLIASNRHLPHPTVAHPTA
jgi:2',3'-cyclic-nucleotide 2'-phosphodiesterase (5'-nucleotidase family)